MLSMNGLKVGKYIPNSTIKTDPLTSSYTIQNNIGRGKFAVVKKCIHNETKEVVAAKFIKKRRKGKTCREEILREVVMLEQALEHPRLVDLLEVYESPQELILVTEYCAGGELFQECVIEESFREHDVIRFLIQILEGLTYLHERNIVHLDLKPQNILLTEPFPGGNIKICDLGFACLVNTGEDIRDIIGTPDYVAPEVLDYEPLGTPTDMWSLGALTYVMLTAYSPFAGDTNQETFCNITQVKLDFPESLFGHISPAAQNFIRKLLVKDPRKRLTARQCLDHEWLKSSVIAAEVPSIPSPSDAAFAVSQDLQSTVNYSRRPSIPDLSTKLPDSSERSDDLQHIARMSTKLPDSSERSDDLQHIARMSTKLPDSSERSHGLQHIARMSTEYSDDHKATEIKQDFVEAKNSQNIDSSEMLTSSSTEIKTKIIQDSEMLSSSSSEALIKTQKNLDSSEMLINSSAEMTVKVIQDLDPSDMSDRIPQNFNSTKVVARSVTEMSDKIHQIIDATEMTSGPLTEMSTKIAETTDLSDMLPDSSVEMCGKVSDASETSIISIPSSCCSSNSELSFNTAASSFEEIRQRDVEIDVFPEEPPSKPDDSPVDKSDYKRKDVSMETSEELELSASSPRSRRKTESDTCNSNSTVSTVRCDFSFVKTLTLKIENKNKRHSMEIPMKKHKCNDDMEVNDVDFCDENGRLISTSSHQDADEMNNGGCAGQHFPYCNNTTLRNTAAKICVHSGGNDSTKELEESSDRDSSICLEKCSDSVV